MTKDEDFPERSPAPPQILWLRIGNCSNRALFAWFRPLWPDIERRLLAGDRIVEVSWSAACAAPPPRPRLRP